jgi:2-oxoisovalerate dehydrogenase E1 component beta subunit
MSAVTMVSALNTALNDLMRESDRYIVMGEDVGKLGGVFRVTEGLLEKFGEDRVVDTPLAESSIVGTAIGLAMHGFRPIIEMQFDGFTYPAFNQLVAHLAKIRNRSRGHLDMPVVVRIPFGGMIRAAEHHSESPENLFAHTPGLKVFTPSTPSDGYSMLMEAGRSNDPVIFFEPKHDYWVKEDTVLPVTNAPAGEARTILTGSDLTIAAYGPAVKLAVGAAAFYQETGEASIEVIDLRSLVPFDAEGLARSVRRTGRLVVVHEAVSFGGFGSEVVSEMVEACWDSLLAPPRRVGAYAVPYPAASLEDSYVPSINRIVDTVDACLEGR